ncbi:P-type conjugative transfer protein TrbG [Azohydromonas sp. G-1-1-14]|uniref:P-type conjugative transfer protein TrbG n=1 Tax=Azohydromonas caseinilytica TaxID=2728836 RepID=A0A848FFT7_9BURK|nr:P-type conjugative transfer protein TrbG [Azohydromonas caseinilytica]
MALPSFAADPMASKYFNSANPTLTKQEKDALAIAKRWARNSATGLAPAPGPNGVIVFSFGVQQPNLVCAVLDGCDIALQPGEQLLDMKLTNKLWNVDPVVVPVGPDLTVHLVAKPMDVGLRASLFLYTDRRTYHIVLRSHLEHNMPLVAFTYPEDDRSKLAAVQAQQQRTQERTIPGAGGDTLDRLSFDYKFDNGPKDLRPTRVYNNGSKTVVEMPPDMANGELLSLVVLREEGGLFSDDKQDRLNGRFVNGRYIVDGLFDKAVLVSGVGRNQLRVEITRGGKK